MIVINTARGTLLSGNVRVAKNFDDKARGLLGEAESSAVFFQTRWGIHTFGMKFPMDCVILDEKLAVRAVCENLRPRRFFFWWPGFENVLELPAGTISKTGTQIGDVLETR